MERKGIGPQGLGGKGNNGFWVGSPAQQKCWSGYKAEGKKKSPSGKKTKGGKTKMVNNCVKK
jgi:hypothetical protein